MHDADNEPTSHEDVPGEHQTPRGKVILLDVTWTACRCRDETYISSGILRGDRMITSNIVFDLSTPVDGEVVNLLQVTEGAERSGVFAYVFQTFRFYDLTNSLVRF